jgi:creatinine amidohydrolase/Fe(II)-dependent formamide hydrolase-like protein
MPREDESERRARTMAINQDASIALLKAQQAVRRLNRSVAGLGTVAYVVQGEHVNAQRE